jgi:hypothetical protein
MASSHVKAQLFALVGPVSEFDLLHEQPGRMILAGPVSGLREVGHLFRWPLLQVVPGADPMGLHLAILLAEIYGLWGSYLRLSKAMDRPALLGVYAAQASAEAMLWAQYFGAEEQTFNSVSPIWLPSFSANALNPKIGAMLMKLLKRPRRQAAPLFTKGRPEDEDSELKTRLHQSFVSLKHHGDSGRLAVPLFYDAYARLVEGKEHPQ